MTFCFSYYLEPIFDQDIYVFKERGITQKYLGNRPTFRPFTIINLKLTKQYFIKDKHDSKGKR